MNGHLLILDETHAPQNLQKSLFIFFHSHVSKFEFKELLHLIVIIMLWQLLLLEILFELLPWDYILIQMLELLELVLLHGGFPMKMVDNNSCFKVGWVIVQLEILPRAQQPCFKIFTFLILSIKCSWIDLPELFLQTIQLIPSPLMPDRG